MAIFPLEDWSEKLFGMSQMDHTGGSRGSSQSTSASGPWAAQQPYLTGLWGQAQNLYENQSPFTGQAMNLRAQRAGQGSPLTSAAQQGVLETMQGAYMPGGAKFQDMSDVYMRGSMAPIDSRFSKGGRFGSGLHKQALGESIADKMMLQSGRERQNMMNAFGMAPQLANQDYFDINQLAMAGQIPWQQLQNLQGLFGSPISTSESQSTGQQMSQRGATQGFADVMGSMGGMGGIKCSKTFKENGESLDKEKILEGLKSLNIEKWNYKGEDQKHIGPYAEDFKEIFGVGDGKTISPVDMLSVMFIGIQELIKEQ